MSRGCLQLISTPVAAGALLGTDGMNCKLRLPGLYPPRSNFRHQGFKYSSKHSAINRLQFRTPEPAKKIKYPQNR
eukprot:3086601-Amphidinium_carterae.1